MGDKSSEKELRYKEKALAETSALYSSAKKAESPLRGQGRLTSTDERQALINLMHAWKRKSI